MTTESIETAEIVPPDDLRSVGRFEILARIASGGMGTVYLARASGMGGFQRLVAVKLLHAHLAQQSAFVAMFLDEARLAARIHHTNVVPIVEVGEADGRLFVVMDYVDGATAATLRDKAKKLPTGLPPAIAIRIVLDALAGLHAAHELLGDDGTPLGLVHRDVSPHNILVGVDGIARLTDFGVARAEEQLHHSAGGEIKGKLQYMAPEQMSGAVTLDRRADLFAMGIILWELLAGRRLFTGPASELVYKVLNAPIPPLATVSDAPSILADVVDRALRRSPNERFATAAQFADALERAAQPRALLASNRQVAAMLEEVLAPELARRRERARSFARTGPVQPPPDLTSRPQVDDPTSKNERKSSSAVSAHMVLAQATEPPAPLAAQHPPRRSLTAIAISSAAGAAGLAVVVVVLLMAFHVLERGEPKVGVQPVAPSATPPAATEPAGALPAVSAAPIASAEPPAPVVDAGVAAASAVRPRRPVAPPSPAAPKPSDRNSGFGDRR